VKTRPLPRSAALLTALVALILLLVPLASAGGTGYNLSYTRPAGSTSNAAVDLVSVSSNAPTSGAVVDVTLQVSGSLILNNDSYYYYLLFGGGGISNATAYAFFSNNSTVGFVITTGAHAGFSTVGYTVGNGGSSLSFAINQSAVGPSSSFTLNAWAFFGKLTGSVSAYSYLGTNYQYSTSGGGGGTCSGTTCTPTSSSTALSSTQILGIVGGVVVALIVIALVVVLVVLPRRRAPPQSPPSMVGGAMPPPPPGSPPPSQ
jgi:hypothetical protein